MENKRLVDAQIRQQNYGTRFIIALIFSFVVMLFGCYQPRKTVYKEPLTRGYNGRWMKAGEKQKCDDPCKMIHVGDIKNYKGDTLWLYSVRN